MTADVSLGALKRLFSNAKNLFTFYMNGGTIDGAVIGGTTPAAITGTTITGTTHLATGFFLKSVAATVSAAGTNLATATVLSAQINDVTTVGSSTGVALGASDSVIGKEFEVFSNGAHNLAVYPATSSGTIDGGSAGAAATLTSTKRAVYKCIAANTWISAQLGVVSA